MLAHSLENVAQAKQSFLFQAFQLYASSKLLFSKEDLLCSHLHKMKFIPKTNLAFFPILTAFYKCFLFITW